MFLGQYAPAISAADELIETMPGAMLRIPSPPMADFFESYVSIRQHVLVRFGKWHDISHTVCRRTVTPTATQWQ
jgi:hypothetical protein